MILLVATASTLVGVLAVAAFAKMRAPEVARDGWRALAPRAARGWRGAPYGLAGLEALLAVGLLLPSPLGVAAAAAALALFVAFTVALTLAARRDEEVACGCFGAWSAEPVSWLSVARTASLAALAAGALASGGDGLVRTLAEATATQTATGLAGAVLLGLVLVLTSALGAARGEVGAVERRLATPAPSVGAWAGEVGPASYPLDVNGIPDRTGAPVPDVEVVLAGGQVRRLEHLVGGRGLLLVVVSHGCATCHTLLAELPAWQEELGYGARIQVVTSSDRDRILEEFPDVAPLLALGAAGLRAALDIPGTPAAVLIGADGRVATRVAAGVDEVFGLLAGTLAAVEAAGAEPPT
ncbi:MAG TPA: MauE/DoxX family redox-associated membrane protein [Nocardioides sp.]